MGTLFVHRDYNNYYYITRGKPQAAASIRSFLIGRLVSVPTIHLPRVALLQFVAIIILIFYNALMTSINLLACRRLRRVKK